jgi:hypothetical protein
MGIGRKKLDAPQWFFMWSTGKPYVTTICAWYRKDVISEIVAEVGEPWKKIYGRGGRAVKCELRMTSAS